MVSSILNDVVTITLASLELLTVLFLCPGVEGVCSNVREYLRPDSHFSADQSGICGNTYALAFSVLGLQIKFFVVSFLLLFLYINSSAKTQILL